MRALVLTSFCFVALASATRAQVWQEDFTNQTNDGAWEVYWSNYNQIWAGGGNPGYYLRLDTTGGSQTCHFLEIFPTSWPAGFSGDWRAAGVTGVGLDVNELLGPTSASGEWRVRIGNDNNTPSDTSDDCWVEFVPPVATPQGTGWFAYDFAVPTASPTLPAGWDFGGSCGVGGDAVWNAVIQDVDYWRVRLDTNPLAFCQFNHWTLGVDNLRVVGPSHASYCFGDGSGTACPCGNAGAPGEGCQNSSGAGAQLAASGSGGVTQDDLVFDGAQLLPGQPALLFAGVNAVNGGNGTVFGDGLRCAGGSVVRLGVRVPNASGQATWGPGLAASGGWSAGDTRHFQGWYRDPSGSPCGSAFNLTHGVTVVMTP
ncbi:MAG: hypothetical protein H6828_00125 [Planctomycetes bacterium]|nr:hypothetical protein [Planctomycetota bacterium]